MWILSIYLTRWANMKMIDRIRAFTASYRSQAIGCLIASVVLTWLALNPAVGWAVMLGVLFIPSVGASLYAAPYLLLGVVNVLFGAIIMLAFYLLRIKNSLLVSGVGLSLAYVVLSALNLMLSLPFYLKAALFFLVSCALFGFLMWSTARIKINTVASAVIFVVLLGFSVCVSRVFSGVIYRTGLSVYSSLSPR